MPEWTNNLPIEEHPLEEQQPHADGVVENNEEAAETSIGECTVPTPPPDFIHRPRSSQSPGNPDAAQPTYNPPYKLVDDTIVPQISDIELASTVLYPPTQDEVPTDRQKESSNSYCVMVCLVAIVIAAMAWVVYVVTKNPKIARALQRIANEARRTHEEDTSNKEETPLFRRMFSPVMNSESSKPRNRTSWF